MNLKESLVFWTLDPICMVFAMDLKHTDNNFTDLSSIVLSTIFLQACCATMDVHWAISKCVGKTMLNVFFQDLVAHF